MISMQLKQMRDERGWTNRELSERSGVPMGTVCRIMAAQDSSAPTWPNVCSLVAAMGGSMDELAGLPPRVVPETDNELLKQSLDSVQEAIMLCHKGLAEKNAELEQMRETLDRKDEECKEKDKQVERLLATLEEKNLRLQGHMSEIQTKNKWMTRFFLMAIFLMLVLVSLLLFDYFNPSLGYFRG